MYTGLNRGKAKKVITYDHEGKENGYLMELKKNGHKTSAYLTSANPGCFKGFHMHLEREANYVCIEGEFTVVVYTLSEKNVITKYEENMKAGDELFIPALAPTALINKSDKQATLINFPNPDYDPSYKDEQVEFTEEEILDGKLIDFLNKGK